MLKRSRPIFAVRDVPEAIAFYRQTLGFHTDWAWGTPVGFGGAGWGEVQVMFHLQPELAAHIAGHEHHYWADEIDALHAQHVAASAPIISPIDNKPWGVREYTVRDPNGYHLRFSGPPTYDRPAKALDTMPSHIAILERPFTWEEYQSVTASVEWKTSPAAYAIASRSAIQFVAVDTRSDLVVGITRVMCDADKWHSIWDVAVRPTYQAQRIGTALIETAIARIKATSPGSIIYLFTYKPGFYDTLGFKTEGVTMLRL